MKVWEGALGALQQQVHTLRQVRERSPEDRNMRLSLVTDGILTYVRRGGKEAGNIGRGEVVAELHRLA